MNIGLLTTFLALEPSADSGIGLHFLTLANALAAQGHRVHVVHPTLQPDEAAAALARLSPRWTCDIVPVRTPPWLDRCLLRSWPSRVLLAQLCAAAAANRALHRAVRRHRLELIETHATDAPAWLYLLRRDRPPVLTRVSTTLSQLHATSGIRSRIKAVQALIERLAIHSGDALVTHAPNHRAVICALDGYPPRRFALVPHGLPTLASTAAPTAANDPTDLTALFVGRFEPRKGIDVLLEAIPAVLAACPQAKFILAGSTGDGAVWDTFTRRHPGLAGNRVTAPGRLPGEVLETLYARCALLVAPSRYESFGLVYVEAMRHAKPVIGCAVGGVPDVVLHGKTGLLVPANDAPALADALIRLLRDPALRTRLGEAGRADFHRRFSAAGLANASLALYSAVRDSHQSRVI